jgi:hypothetical protein
MTIVRVALSCEAAVELDDCPVRGAEQPVDATIRQARRLSRVRREVTGLSGYERDAGRDDCADAHQEAHTPRVPHERQAIVKGTFG